MAKVFDQFRAGNCCSSARSSSRLEGAVVDAPPLARPVRGGGRGRDAVTVAFRDAGQRRGFELLPIPLDGRLRNFDAQSIVVREIDYTIAGGRFSPSESIDLTCQEVILSVSGTECFRLSIPPGSIRETGLGGFVASERRGLVKTDILLQPLKSGEWVYSLGLAGFLPGSASVAVSLTVGGQAGRAAARVCKF